jgi:hypothetical protein
LECCRRAPARFFCVRERLRAVSDGAVSAHCGNRCQKDCQMLSVRAFRGTE